MLITIYTEEVAAIFVGSTILTVLIIITFKHYFKSVSIPKSNSSDSRTKYEIIDIFKYRNSLLLSSIGISLALCLTLISWTEKELFIKEISHYTVENDIEIIPLITYFTPPPPPPAPLLIIEIPDEIIEEIDQTELTDMSIDETTIMDEPAPVVSKPSVAVTPPPPPVRIVDIEPEIVGFAEKMPLFGGCADKTCSDKALMNYLYANLKYPAIARENRLEGRVFIQFVVETDGRISAAKIVRDIGGGCGEAAKKVIEAMNDLEVKWTPGKQNGRAVRVLFTLPVTFKLAE